MKIKEISIVFNGDKEGNQEITIGGGKFDGKIKQIPFTKTEGLEKIKALCAENYTVLSATLLNYESTWGKDGLVTSNTTMEDLLKHPRILKGTKPKTKSIQNPNNSNTSKSYGSQLSHRRSASGEYMTIDECIEQDAEFEAEGRIS